MDEESTLLFTATLLDGVAVVEVTSPDRMLGRGSGSEFVESVRQAVDSLHGPPDAAVLLDLRGIDYFLGTACGFLLMLVKQLRAEGIRFGICPVLDIKEVFALCRIDGIIPCFLSLPEGVEALSRPARSPDS